MLSRSCFFLILLSFAPVLHASTPFAPISVEGAVVAGGHMIRPGTSVLKAHWGPVLAKGDMTLTGLAFNGSAKNLSVTSTKFYGAGVSPEEYWVHWRTAGTLLDEKRVPLFPAAINGVPVTDFFAQLMNGDFNVPGSTWYAYNGVGYGPFTLTGYSSSDPGQVRSPWGPSILCAPTDFGSGRRPLGRGALVQGMAEVGAYVDEVLTTGMEYARWKNFAIQNNAYVRPDAGGSFRGPSGQILYVTPQKTLTTVASGNPPLTTLRQLSMKSLVPADGDTTRIPDRCLFVDTLSGTAAGARTTITLTAMDEFFWKGALYLNADLVLSSAGGGAPSVLGRSPRQSETMSGSTSIAGCLMDGILFTSGTLSTLGSGTVYGALVTPASVPGNLPEVFYNSRLAAGLFRAPSDGGTGPVPSISSPSRQVTSTSSVTFQISYLGAPLQAITLSTSTVILKHTGSADADVEVQVHGLSSASVILTNIRGDGTLGISLAPGTAVDISGEQAVAGRPSAMVLADNTPPVASISGPFPPLAGGNSPTATYFFTFDDATTLGAPLLSPEIHTTGTVSMGGAYAETSGTTHLTQMYVFDTGSGDGEFSVSLPEGYVVDAAGNRSLAAGPSAAAIVDNTPPDSATSVGDGARTGTEPFAVSFMASDGNGSGVRSTTLLVRAPGQEMFTHVPDGRDLPGSSGTVLFFPVAGPGRYEFISVSSDHLGNLEAEPEEADAEIVINTVPGSPFTQDVPAGDSTLVFPLTDDYDVTITLTGVTAPGTLTVSRISPLPAGTEPSYFRRPSDLLREALVITAGGGLLDGGFTATLEWSFDPDLVPGNGIDRVYRFEGDLDSPTGVYTVAPMGGSGKLRVTGIDGFSTWYAGNSAAVPVTVSGFSAE